REREKRERVVCVTERRERERESVVCVVYREREYVCERERERERVCERERERRESVSSSFIPPQFGAVSGSLCSFNTSPSLRRRSPGDPPPPPPPPPLSGPEIYSAPVSGSLPNPLSGCYEEKGGKLIPARLQFQTALLQVLQDPPTSASPPTKVRMSVQAVNVSAVCGEQGNLSVEVTDYNASCANSSVLRRPATRTREMDSLRILLYSLIFLISVFGNLLIIVVLMLNKRMRTVTNSFLLSLAVSDLMMAIFCMPFTLIPNILEDFIFGAAMCKTVSYFMGISVSISTFSLVAIAIERYSAICNPLKSRSWQTRSHAYRANHRCHLGGVASNYGALPGVQRPQVLPKEQRYVLLLFTLFFVPGVVMIIAYGLISRELYRGIQFELGQNTETTGQKNGVGRSAAGSADDDDGCYIQVSKKPSSAVELPTLSASSGAGQAKTERARSNTSEAKLQAKRRVIRMLMVIVALFFICWMPLYSANTWKAFDLQSASRALSGAPISFIHLLSYTSACVNPVIYCFMNTRFRKALLSTFACCCRNRLCRHCRWCRRREAGDDGITAASMATSMATSMSKFSYTTVSTTGTC
ncbi:hypothetical protein L3Q82_009892, partial [Scortum barcoo]